MGQGTRLREFLPRKYPESASKNCPTFLLLIRSKLQGALGQISEAKGAEKYRKEIRA